jgi:hypothetical protein
MWKDFRLQQGISQATLAVTEDRNDVIQKDERILARQCAGVYLTGQIILWPTRVILWPSEADIPDRQK